jgi:uncharacterized membrane protein
VWDRQISITRNHQEGVLVRNVDGGAWKCSLDLIHLSVKDFEMGFIVSIGFFLFAGVFWLLASQIKSGALPRNGDFGIRTRLTKSSDESWDAAHKAALPLLSLTAWVALSLGLLTIAISLILHDEWVLLVFVGVGYAILILLTVLMTIRANDAARSN